MFQTEIVHFVQSFESPILTDIMLFITSLGYTEFFLVFILTVMFGINFKKGFLLLHILIITGIFTEFLKGLFALPRPSDVDSGVLLPGNDYPNSSPFANMGATGFFNLLPDNVVRYYRGLEGTSYGLPSGHTSTAAALWGSIYIIFQKNWVKIISIALIILIPLSRIYLGRHFLADVLAGYIVGFTILALFYFIAFKKD